MKSSINFNRNQICIQVWLIVPLLLFIIFVILKPIYITNLTLLGLNRTEIDPLIEYRGPMAVIHSLCKTSDPRDLVILSMKQDGMNVTASVLAGSSKVLPENSSFIHEIDFLIMWERGGQAVSSSTFYTHCFINFRLNTSINCEVIGFGVVKGQLVFSYQDGFMKESRLLCPVHPLHIPKNLDLEIRLVDHASQLNGTIRLCRLNLRRKIHRIVGCSQPLYNVHLLEAKWPGLIRMWARYYVDYLGFGYINIYDIDGSTEPYLGDLVQRGVVKYYKSWAPTESMRQLALGNATYCSETLMENQCLWQSRGLSEWTMLIHAPDNYLNDVFGSKNLLTYLDQMKNTTSAVLLETMIYGVPNRTIPQQDHASKLFKVIQVRECQPIRGRRHLPVLNPREVMMLFVHVVMYPFNYVRMDVKNCPVYVNHYVTMFRSRSIHPGSQESISHCHDATLYNRTIPYLQIMN